MNRASRRNISITDEFLDNYLDTQVSNVSAFIQDALRAYIKEQDVSYAKEEDLEELKREVEILNENYLQTKDVLVKISKVLFEN